MAHPELPRLPPRLKKPAGMMTALQRAHADHLRATFDQVTASYVSITSYIVNGLQLDQATLNAIRRRMLV
ncbi:tyrosine-protein phosphatase [Burkholderia pyrrocinia]|uniref:tyrosine-protein phosphatase n=1 Tax=Burkholderia pyrrocinia TaxID=60550 RepID=UPI001FB83779|nr:tyrosine-protein phosphatase [Burkholderia pyrrocinia]